jgi:hypothetical protein
MALTAASSRPILALVTMVLAGSVEGAVLGSAQADCLYRWRVLPVRRWWIIATSLGAAFAWSLGMLPSTLGGVSWTARTAVAVGIGGLMLLTSLPLAQYFVLRDHVERASLWIPINVAAWLLGIAWTLLPSPWIDQSTSTGTLILVYSVAGLCMAATVAVVSGLGMSRLLHRRPRWVEMGKDHHRGVAIMPGVDNATNRSRAVSINFPFRRTIVAVETVIGLAGLAGSIQLLAGVATPEVSVLSPLGLSSWSLPAGWLFLSVAVPSSLAGWLAWRRSLWAPPAVLLASALLAIELLVQIPFLGFSVLQLIFGTVALGMAVVGLLARSAGWWPSRSPVAGGLRPARPEEP